MPCSHEEFVRLMEEEANRVECDTCTPGELELSEPPWFNQKIFTRSWKSLLTVRKRHLRVSKQVQKTGEGVITQRDLVITLFGFFGYGLLKPEKLGMWVDDKEDIEAYLHFWRTIGFMVGIHDKYNFCDGSINEVKEKMQYICDDFCKPHLTNPPENYYHMVKALLDGMFYISIFIKTKPYLYYAYRLNDIPGFQSKKDGADKLKNGTQTTANGSYNTNKSIKNGYNLRMTENFIQEKSVTDTNSNEIKNVNFYNRLDGERLFNSMTKLELKVFDSMINIFQHGLFSRVGRWIYNAYFFITFLFLQYVPYVAILRFGLKGSFVNMFAEDVAEPTTLKTNRQVLEELYGNN